MGAFTGNPNSQGPRRNLRVLSLRAFQGHQTQIDTSPEKTSRWPRGTVKGTQHHSLLEKRESKPQGVTTSHLPGWPSSKGLQTINAGEAVEKREPSHTAGGKVNSSSHSGEQY